MKAPVEIRRSIWIELLVIGAIIAIIIFPFQGNSYRRFATNTLRYQKGTVVEIISEELSESPQKTGNLLGLQELTVRLSGGEVVPIHNYLTDTHNILLNEGDSAIICVDAPKNAAPYYTVYQYDRTGGFVALTTMFFGLMLLIGGRKGFDALLALVFSSVFLICVVLPLLYNGVSPILVGFITVLLLTLVTLLLLHGVTKECLLGIGVTLLGELAACILFGIFSGALHLSGLQLGEAEELLLITQNTGLKIESVLFTGMMLASLGAVMDVAVSVLAALQEVADAMSDPESKALFGSGMRIGKNMLGTMSNTLIFAFAGGALTTMLVFFSYGVQFHQIFHSDYLALELSQGLCSTAAVILTVPAASLVGAFAFSDKKNPFTTGNSTFKKERKLDASAKKTSRGNRPKCFLMLVLISTLLIFLWPRSFLGSIDEEIKSVSVVIIENTLEHEQTAYTFEIGDPEFHEIMEVLKRYSYHISTGTIAKRFKNNGHVEDNHAGY